MQTFAPLYDVLSVYPYADKGYFGTDLTLCLLHSETDGVFSQAFNKYGYYTRADFIALAENIGLPSGSGLAIVNNLVEQVEKAYKYIIGESQCPDDMKSALISHINSKIRRLRKE
jgi:serine/threonine-protein kinase HipA